MLEPAYASFPYKIAAPRYEVSARRRDGGFILLVFHGRYAAARMVTRIIGSDDIEWKTPTHLITSSGIHIKSPQLEELVEHEDTAEEARWDFTIPNSTYLNAFLRQGPHKPNSDQEAADPGPAQEKRAPRPQAEPKPDGLTSIQDITTELGMDPREARQILRKHSQKPSGGSWAWAKDQVAGIKKLLKEKRK